MTTPITLKFGDPAAIEYRKLLERIYEMADIVRSCEDDHAPYVCPDCDGSGESCCPQCDHFGECLACDETGVTFHECRLWAQELKNVELSRRFALAVALHLAGATVEQAWLQSA